MQTTRCRICMRFLGGMARDDQVVANDRAETVKVRIAMAQCHDPLEPYRRELADLAGRQRLRACRTLGRDPADARGLLAEGRPLVDFSSNDYLGLTRHPALAEAAKRAIDAYGGGSGAARLVTGTLPLHTDLERAVADWKGTEAALLLNSGYQANLAILQGLCGPGDWILADRLNHASLLDGCLLSGARWSRYPHLDLERLEAKLQALRGKYPDARIWVATDGVFSMDGDWPDLGALAYLAERHGAALLVDEAHAAGLYGEEKASGLLERYGLRGVETGPLLQMGTFGKALGGFGAYVAGPGVLIDTLVNKARGFVYPTALPPAVVASNRAAVGVVQAEPRHRERLWANVASFNRLLSDSAHSVLRAAARAPKALSPIVPIALGDDGAALAASRALETRGFLVAAIRPPTVPTARLRVTLSATHTAPQLEGLVEALAACLPRQA